jgi:hypothetical protein
VKIKLLVTAGVAVAVIVAGIATWALWPPPTASPQGSASRYLNASACLLTGPSGITPGTASAPVWTAMRSASQATHVMVSYLPDSGPTDVTPMLNTLVERHCGVIIATSDADAAVTKAARANPRQSFLLVAILRASGAAAARGTPNTVVVPAADASGRIDQALHMLAAHSAKAGS